MRRIRWMMGLILAGCISVLTPALWGQLNNSNPWPSSGNVGIGTPNPSVPLTLITNTPNTVSFGIQNLVSNGYSQLGLWGTGRTYQVGVGNGSETYFGVANKFYIYDGAAAAMRLVMDTSGNVVIGTSQYNANLNVIGNIVAKEISVTATGADYVFQPGYHLSPLSEVSAFIKENHHLPEIPSEKEVAERGISVGSMQMKLLAKVEELTLHMIAAEERSNRLEQENQELQQKIVALKADLARIDRPWASPSTDK